MHSIQIIIKKRCQEHFLIKSFASCNYKLNYQNISAAALGDLRNDNDANCTYEGENSVLIQQTSNWLLNLYKTKDTSSSPLKSADFIVRLEDILQNHGKWTPRNMDECTRIESK